MLKCSKDTSLCQHLQAFLCVPIRFRLKLRTGIRNWPGGAQAESPSEAHMLGVTPDPTVLVALVEPSVPSGGKQRDP